MTTLASKTHISIDERVPLVLLLPMLVPRVIARLHLGLMHFVHPMVGLDPVGFGVQGSVLALRENIQFCDCTREISEQKESPSKAHSV